MTSEISLLIPVAAAAITGVCSFAGAWLASVVSKNRDRAHESRQIAKAFKGEMEAIVSILELRNYQAGLRVAAENCLKLDEVQVYAVSVQKEYFAVYKANIGKLGWLEGGLPEQIAVFYTHANSLLEDFYASVEIREGRKSISLLGAPKDAAARYQRTADHIDSLVSMAKVVINQVDQLYRNNR